MPHPGQRSPRTKSLPGQQKAAEQTGGSPEAGPEGQEARGWEAQGRDAWAQTAELPEKPPSAPYGPPAPAGPGPPHP